MFEANFSSSSLDLHEDLALEELEHPKWSDVVFEAWNGCAATAISLRHHICQDCVAGFRSKASFWPKHRLKAAICFAENLPCDHVALAARNIREYSKQNFEQVWWPTNSKAHTRSRYLAAQENPTTIWEGRQHNTHNFMKVEVCILHWMFFCDNVSQKHFRIFFNWEIDTCRRYAHLITSSYIKKDENMWLMGIPLDSFAQLEF